MKRFTDRLTIATILGSFLISGVASAQAFQTAARNAYILDLSTGTTLLSKKADIPMPPASMSKLMTIYMVFDRVKRGSLSLDDTFLVSKKA